MVLYIFAFTYSKSFFLPLGEMITLFTVCTFLMEKKSGDTLEKMEQSSFFPQTWPPPIYITLLFSRRLFCT